MPSFKFLSQQQIATIIAFVKDTIAQQSFETANIPKNNEPYGFNGYSFYLDTAGDPAIAPPFGTMTAIDLNTGKYVWKIPLGEYRELAAQGLANTGCENYGGPVVTAGGLVFIGATNYDGKFRAFDKATGALLWETTLPAPGNATPATYEVDGRQFVVIAASSGKLRTQQVPASYVAFALPVGQ